MRGEGPSCGARRPTAYRDVCGSVLSSVSKWGLAGVVQEQRPPLTASMTGSELRRWYWLRSELVSLARALGVSSAGGKVELADRLTAVLDGDEPPPRLRRPAPATPLPRPLTGATVLPVGQRATQDLRAWLVDQIGTRFRFDAAMRVYIAEGAIRHRTSLPTGTRPAQLSQQRSGRSSS